MQQLSQITSKIPSNKALKHLIDIKFENSAFKSLPIDPNSTNKVRQVSGYCYSKTIPTPRENPRIVALSPPCLEMLGFDPKKIEEDPESAEYLAGNKLLSGSEPIAHCYCGYQFGSWAGQLGDGRAITLGDFYNDERELWELQLKGSGLTPYSRFADGKAVLRSSIREFLCSEAMWALGIPTTRAASIVVTDTLADRDPLYSGDVIKEKCAVVMRVAPTFQRFGTFEIFKGPSQTMEKTMMPKMLDYLLKYHYQEVLKEETSSNRSREDSYLEMYYEIVKRTAKLVALWQCYGFMHGVLNTDNMSILGLTIDYGPFGWMDHFNKRHICNHSDNSGRYSYENQPSVCKWNLGKLAEALRPMVPYAKTTKFLNENYDKLYKEYYYGKMREKIGLLCYELEEDIKLVDDLLDLMHANASDFTNTFRKLSDVPVENTSTASSEVKHIEIFKAQNKPTYHEHQIAQFKLLAENNIHLLMMMGIDPDIIEVEEEKIKRYKELQSLTKEAMIESVRAKWVTWMGQYLKRLAREAQSVNPVQEESKDEKAESSTKKVFSSVEEWQSYRKTKMNQVNPLYVLRNYMAEEAIKKAEENDFSGVKNLLQILLNPFVEAPEVKEATKYKQCPPKWASEICVSCSS